MTNYKHVSSTYNSLLFCIIVCTHMSIILLKLEWKSKSFHFIQDICIVELYDFLFIHYKIIK